MRDGIERALESIADWDVWGTDAEALDASTSTCPNCGYTGTMDPPVGIMPKAKKVDPSMAAAAFYDSYQDLRDALCQAVATKIKYAYIVDFGSDWVIYTDDSEKYWKSTYSVGDNGALTLLDKTEVHRVFVPVAS